jgi:SAM-dependent methyltransferase
MQRLLDQFTAAVAQGIFVKCTLSRIGPAAPNGLKALYLRPVEIKKQVKIAFNYRYQTKDEVKNHTPAEAVELLQNQLGKVFLNADLFTTEADYTLSFDKKGTAHWQEKPPANTHRPELGHDRAKHRLLDPKAAWLHLLGITSTKGEVYAHAQDKWRQINKFLEIIEALLREHPLPAQPHIADMGSGKGYLTFALYDFLANVLQHAPQITGIELRPALVETCNEVAQKVGFGGLRFEAADINKYRPERLDMLIALHACDTATDMALGCGVRNGCGIVVVAPCCHKQIRKAMNPQNALTPILHNGILLERQAEIVTDGIRALLLEASGYQTKVFEFISSEHTAKNVMITATKFAKHTQKRAETARRQVSDIKAAFGIEQHFLEKLV